MTLLVVRLFYLQIERRMVFSSLGRKNFLRIEIIPPLRGDVYDCRHELLAANRPVFDVFWQGVGRVLAENDLAALKKIETIIQGDFFGSARFPSLCFASKYARRMLLKEDVSFEQLCQLSEQCADVANLVIANRFQRTYPHGQLACHILGYLNRGEHVGQSGVERKFDTELQGQEGQVIQVINSTGKMLTQQIAKQAKAGADISLTLDFQLQRLAEKTFEGDQAGAFIVMDPADGAIRALVSCPRFDPNIFLHSFSDDTWEQLVVNNPLLNRATSAMYPPASTFKVVTWAAGLDEGVAAQNSELFCNGYVTFCGRKYYCMQHLGHGALTPKQALVVSCNCPCFHMARKLSIDCLADYARRFGLGEKTGFLLSEKSGLVPTTTWKKQVKGERWWKGDTLSVSIGQGYLLVTPLQVARMVGSICTGWLVGPRLLESEPVAKKKLNISGYTLAFLRNAMKEVVIEGTGRRLGKIQSFEISAKTGTAQTCSLTKEKNNNKYLLEHGWLAGYFSYKGQKPLVMVVLLENTGSSHEAVQFAANFLREYKAFMEAHETPATV